MNVRFLPVYFAAAVLAAGCGPPEAPFVRYETVAHKIALEQGQKDFPEDRRRDIDLALVMMFGTPDVPALPALDTVDIGQVASLPRLKLAAGRVGSDEQGNPRGLYRKHCAHCHGITGDGAGPTAVFLNPYPRDYRKGQFKFKSTPVGQRPTHDDLKKIVIDGIPGTAMPSFKLLADLEVEALVDYVKYLAMRGEVERALLMATSQLGEKDRLVSIAAKGDAAAQATEQEQLTALRAAATTVVKRWLAAPNVAAVVPERPKLTEEQLAASQKRGRDLFYGAVANCIKCHGESALGDGNLSDYDEWVKDLYDPAKNPQLRQEFVARGLLEPRNIRPRNLRLGVYRGGLRPLDIYWRIKNGIDGTPMPAALMKPEGEPNAKGLVPDDIWDLVSYVQSLPYEQINNPLAAVPEAENPGITP